MVEEVTSRAGGVHPEERGKKEKDMKPIYHGLIVILFVFLISSVADAEFYNGQKLVEDWKAYKMMSKPKPLKSPKLLQGMAHYMGYVVGVIDSNYDLIFFPPDVTVEQLFRAVGKYLDVHPEKWQEPAVNLVLQALMEHLSGEESKKDREYTH
jgi:Rap1a immunity proteins